MLVLPLSVDIDDLLLELLDLVLDQLGVRFQEVVVDEVCVRSVGGEKGKVRMPEESS